MADRFPFMRVYAEMASQLSKEDRADFYDALVAYALNGEEPAPSTGAAVFQAARRMVDTWKMKSAAGKASAAKRGNVFGGCSEGVRNTTRTDLEHSATKEEKNKRITNKPNNITKEKSTSLKGGTRKEAAADAADRPSRQAMEIMELYNAICTSLPKVRELSRDRVEKIKLRLKNHSADELRQAFTKAEASDFCTGRDGKSNKWCNFDWMMKSETNLLKLLEGNYDNNRSRTSNPLDAADRVADALINSADPEAVAEFERSMNSGGFTS